jgi:hypothetical protein
MTNGKFATLVLVGILSIISKKEISHQPKPVISIHNTGKNLVLRHSEPLKLSNLKNKVINGIEIDNAKVNCIQLFNCYNITIKNCRIIMSTGNAIDLYQCKNVTIKDCYIENVATGLYALECQGIAFLHNQVKDVTGPFPRGQMVQFNNVSGKNNIISNNRCENIKGKSNPEDVISMFKSNGTPDSPVIIADNWIRGGGPSTTGGGIMLGDNGGSYIVARHNVLVNPGQYGIAISGGSHIQIVKNKVYSKQQPFTNVGIYVYNQNPSACVLNTVSGNIVNWRNSTDTLNNIWNNGNCGSVSGWDTNVSMPIDSTILPQKIITE